MNIDSLLDYRNSIVPEEEQVDIYDVRDAMDTEEEAVQALHNEILDILMAQHIVHARKAEEALREWQRLAAEWGR